VVWVDETAKLRKVFAKFQTPAVSSRINWETPTKRRQKVSNCNCHSLTLQARCPIGPLPSGRSRSFGHNQGANKRRTLVLTPGYVSYHPHNKGGTSLSNGVVAQIRTPTEDELKRMRDLWGALKQKPLPASTERGIELQTYLAHAARMVGIIAGLHPVTGKPAVANKSPMTVSEDGVERLRDSARLWSAILSLWSSTTGT